MGGGLKLRAPAGLSAREAAVRRLLLYTVIMSKIGSDEVERLARLARIGLTPEEAEHFAVELGQIVGFVEQLQSVDVSDTSPTDQVTGLTNVLRADEARPAPQSREELLANAPAREDGYIKVARVRE